MGEFTKMDGKTLLSATMTSLGHDLSMRHAQLCAEDKRLKSSSVDSEGRSRRIKLAKEVRGARDESFCPCTRA